MRTDLRTALRECAGFVRNHEGSHELFATWLLGAVAAHDAQDEARFSIDAASILDVEGSRQQRPVEHLLVVPNGSQRSAEDRIVEAIRSRLPMASEGLELLVFIEGLGTDWFATRVAERLPRILGYDAVWVITRQASKDREYVYGISHLDLSFEHCPVWFITIPNKFDRWTVRQIN